MPPPPPGKEYFHKQGPACLVDTIQAEGKFDFGQKPEDILRPFFEDIFDNCAMERPEHLD